MKRSGELANYIHRTATVQPIAKSTASKPKPKPKKAVPKDTVIIERVNSDNFWRPFVGNESGSSSWNGVDVGVADLELDEDKIWELLEEDVLDDNHKFLLALVHAPALLNGDILLSITSLPSVASCSGIWSKLMWRPPTDADTLPPSDQLPPMSMRCYIPEPMRDSPKFRCFIFATLILWTVAERPEYMSRQTCELQSKVAAEFNIKHDEKIVGYCTMMDDAVYDLMYGLYIKALINPKQMQWLFDETTLRVLRAIDPEGMAKWDEDRAKIGSADIVDLPEGFWEKVYFKAIKSWLKQTARGQDCSFGARLKKKFLRKFRKEMDMRNKP